MFDSPNFQRNHFSSIDSTQNYLAENLDLVRAAGGKLVITADEQTKGKGTQNRFWASPPHVNIYATFGITLPLSLDLKKAFQQPVLTQLVALGVSKTLSEFGIHSSIKWRNDVRVEGGKIAGILCELPAELSPPIVLIGIGLNVNMTKEMCDTVVDQQVTSMKILLDRDLDKEQVFSQLEAHLYGIFQLYIEKGFSCFLEEIQERLEGISTRIQVEREDKTVLEGVHLGIDEEGQLKLKLDTGEEVLISRGRILKDSLVPTALTPSSCNP